MRTPTRPDLDRRPADSGLLVEVGAGERVDGALKRFAKIVVRAGVFTDLRHHRYALSPGERRRAKRKEARTRLLRQMKVHGISRPEDKP